jgi:Tol biopolymer transport system component
LSPDATRAAGRDAAQGARGDIWLLEMARGVRTRLTFRQSAGSAPIWSPDGSRIMFAAGNTLDTIYEKPASGAGDEKELFSKPGEIKVPSSWSRDGRFLLYNTTTPKTKNDLWVLPLEGDRKPVLLLGTDFNEDGGIFSPDGRWIIYVSDESGRNELYVRPFVASGPSGATLGEGRWQVSRDGGTGPKWRNDGKEIVFMGPDRAMMTVEVNGSGAAFQVGTAQKMFTAPDNSGWDVSGDGKRFLMSVEGGIGPQSESAPITVVLNWQSDLKQ